MIVVTAIAALVLAGMIAGVTYKTRTMQNRVNRETPRDQVDASCLRRQQSLADEYALRARAAQIEIDIKTIRAGNRLRQHLNK